jgi:general secretion pathway protein D
MNSSQHNFLTQSLCAWLCLALIGLPLKAAPHTNVSGVRVREDKGMLLATIEMDSAAPFQHFTLSNPSRIVIDIRNARQTITATEEQILIPINQGGLARARVGQMGSTVRVVFDTTAQVRSEVTRRGTTLLVRFHQVNQTPIKTGTPATTPTRQGSAKKHFQEGMKQEALQRWELAAQEFTLAVQAEPSNTEYRLHLLRALQKASLASAHRGDALVAQQDFAGAFTAYYQAFTFDPTNELARVKMERMREQQSQPTGAGKYEIVTANATTSSADIKLPQSSRANDLLQAINFRDTDLRQVIEFMAEKLELNVLFDESFKNDTNFRLKLNNVTMARALDLVLLQTHHTFEQVERRTILIYADNATNRQRNEQMLVKTFYLGNADLEQARTLLQAISGAQHPVIPVKQLNALVIRDTASNLRMMQELLDSIDKNRAEVVIDVDIYEVSRHTSLEIGNQLALTAQPVTQTRFDTNGNPVTVTTGQSSSLGNLGGIGRAGLAGIAGTAVSPVLGGVGTLLGLPPSSLSLLQSKGQSKLLASSQIHALDGEQNQTKVGRSVPVRLGTSLLPGYSALPAQGAVGQVAGALQNVFGGGYGVGGFDSIQYRDVGLVIDVTPAISKEGYVQIKMKLESTSVEAASAEINLTPSFTQRSLTTVARVLDGKTAVVAGIKQEAKGDARAGLPFVGMLPVLGRFFSTPRQTGNLSDIIITVTPHILRAPKLNHEDHLARSGGSQKGGVLPTIEEVVQRLKTEDDEDRQRRGPQRPQAPPVVTARIAEVKAPVTEPAARSPEPRQAVAAVQETKREEAEAIAQPTSLEVAAPNENSAGQVNRVSLKAVPISMNPRVGETFTVAVAVNGAASMTGASVSLNFDPTRVQFKAVRDGGLLGNRALLRQQVNEGRLHLTLQPPSENAAPAFAQGQLFLVEFTALEAGEARIEFDLNETSLQLTSAANVEVAARPAQITIRQ